jgi:pyruvate dehydrogenase phosphatase
MELALHDFVDNFFDGMETEMAERALTIGVQGAHALSGNVMDLELAQRLLDSKAENSVTMTAVGHTCSLPSNLPSEDTVCSGTYTYFNDPTRDWSVWAIFDGHCGPRMSEILKRNLPHIIGGELMEAGCMDRAYVPNDQHVIQTIKKSFTLIDNEFLDRAREHIEKPKEGEPRALLISLAAAAHAGSCALVALYDPKRSVLRVANTGDSRAVLGRWNQAQGKYVAQAMSTDQTGFNQDEVARLQREHPGEDTVDPKTGRVFGLAVTRAFGDARWKWPEEVTRRAHELFCGPAPRPNGVIKTPPYLTAEPEVTEVKLRDGAHPDFLIMASDGLWDNMSSEDAVTCVQLWLDKNKPTNFLEKPKEMMPPSLFGGKEGTTTLSSVADLNGAEDDTYYDAEEKCLKWRVSPKHFINEDQNCGVHLVKNALGGRRRDLFTGVMSVAHPWSRNIRDDISVTVLFFGQDVQMGSISN